jgi:hypothetical protein
LEIITIKDPITDEEYIVELRYDGKKMMGGADGLSFREPASDKSMFMLTVPKEYADALGLGENRKLDNLMRFDDFIKEENTKVVKKRNKVKSAKDYVKVREDYIYSFKSIIKTCHIFRLHINVFDILGTPNYYCLIIFPIICFDFLKFVYIFAPRL